MKLMLSLLTLFAGSCVAGESEALEAVLQGEFKFPSRAEIENGVGKDPDDEANFFTFHMCSLADKEGKISDLLGDLGQTAGRAFGVINPPCAQKINSSGGLVKIFFASLPEQKQKMIIDHLASEFRNQSEPQNAQQRFFLAVGRLLLSTAVLPAE